MLSHKMDCVSDGFEVQGGRLLLEGIEEGPDGSNGMSREDELGSLSFWNTGRDFGTMTRSVVGLGTRGAWVISQHTCSARTSADLPTSPAPSRTSRLVPEAPATLSDLLILKTPLSPPLRAFELAVPSA